MANIVDILEARGFIETMTDSGLRERANKPMSVYCGFDPTADSLHIGNLVGIMGLAWFQRLGHTPVVIVGGATGFIGDPSGKSTERSFLDEKTLANNIHGIRKDLQRILDFSCSTNPAKLLNNFDWYREMSCIEFLREVGRYFRLGPMLAKDSVRSRLQSDEGMSFTEFSYQLLQGYDFLQLFDQHQVEAQIGGSDQWGNITAGTDLIRKVRGQAAHGLTFPLLTRSDGKKFGKSEQGAIWLSPEKLSPYEFYQYFFRVADADVARFMRMLTFMDLQEIEQIEQEMAALRYLPNTAQKRLAEEVTRIVHGEEGVQAALKATQGMKPGTDTALDAATLESLDSDVPSCSLARPDVVGAKFIDLLVLAGLQPSKGQARRLVENGGAYLNNAKITSVEHTLAEADLIDGRLLLLAVGKKNKLLLKVQ